MDFQVFPYWKDVERAYCLPWKEIKKAAKFIAITCIVGDT
jgi:hypothetical protein